MHKTVFLVLAFTVCLAGKSTAAKVDWHSERVAELNNLITSRMESCTKLFCAKCGQVLECYVNSCDGVVDQRICSAVESVPQFCPGNGRSTTCGQQCNGAQGVKCFAGTSWSSCPAIIGVSTCNGGAGGNNGRDVLPAELSNFAVYKACVSSESVSFECIGEKCDGNAGTQCSCMPEQPPPRPVCSPGVARVDPFLDDLDA